MGPSVHDELIATCAEQKSMIATRRVPISKGATITGLHISHVSV